MNVLDLFSGIGGFSLGLERAGMRTVAFCEIDPSARRVLAKNWSGIPIYEDIRSLSRARLTSDGIFPTAICGGFPCQDISTAGKGAGISGERSGLWKEYARLIGELRPRYVIVENVAALLGRGMDVVLGDLASLGYDAEWSCIPASAIGAPHRRDRVWIVAYPKLSPIQRQRQYCGEILPDQTSVRPSCGSSVVANATSERCRETREYSERQTEWVASSRPILPDADSEGFQVWDASGNCPEARPAIFSRSELKRAFAEIGWKQWGVEPNVGRVANGVPGRVDRLRQLGNAVVPQIPEIIGRAIIAAENEKSTGEA